MSGFGRQDDEDSSWNYSNYANYPAYANYSNHLNHWNCWNWRSGIRTGGGRRGRD